MLNDIQINLFLSLWKSDNLLNTSRGFISLDDFDYEPVKFLLGKLLNFSDKHKLAPPIDFFKHELNSSSLNEGTKAVCEEILIQEFSDKTAVFARDVLLQYIRKKRFIDIIERSKQFYERNEIERAERVLKESSIDFDLNTGLNYFENTKQRLHDYVAKDPEGERIPVLIPKLDDILEGGFGKKELTIALGLPGSGKTAFCIHCCKAAAICGVPTLYVSLEVDVEMVAQRLDAAFSGLHLYELSQPAALPELKEKLETFGRRSGNIIIKQFAKCDLRLLQSYIEVVKSQYPLKFIIVDYGDLLVTSNKADRRFELEEIYNTLRSYAVQYDCAFLVPSQANRAALGMELITMANASESFSKMMVADCVLSLNQTEEDKKHDRMRIFVAKNRRGLGFKSVTCDVDFSRMLIKGIDDGEEMK